MYEDLINISKKYFGVVYLMTNLINNKIYIGQTTNLKSRIKDYKYKKYDNRKHNKYEIIKEINLFGFNNFKFKLLDFAENQNDLWNKEEKWIYELKATDPDIGYNKKSGGVGGVMTEDSKLKMSNTTSLFRHSIETKIKKSKKIIVFRNNVFKIFQSAKTFSEIIQTNRTCVTRAIKKANRIKGYFVFYYDTNERQFIINQFRDNVYKQEYLLIEKMIHDVETIENYYFIY